MKKLLAFMALGAILLSSCNDDDADAPQNNLQLDIQGLEDLGQAAQYEGWVIVNGAPVSTGTFTVDGNGTLSSTTFTVDPTNLASATAFVLTIEPIPDTDPAPSAVKILGGDFSSSTAQVSISHGAALGTGFTGVTGGYILTTPTTTTADDDLSGVWFIQNGMAGLQNLPDLSDLDGWIYEGWAVIDGTPVSTGTFEMANGADDAAPFSGQDADGPPYPGEDFILNAPSGLTFPTNLSGQAIVISIEPVPDNSPAPFTLKPLRGMVPANAAPLTFYEMDNIAAGTYPSGTVQRN